MSPWLKRVSGGASVLAAAEHVGMDQSTLNRQMKATPTEKTVVRIARAYKADPIAALVELGLITAEEAGAQTDLTEAQHLAWLQDQPDEVLLREIGRRFEKRSDLDEPGAP